MVIALMEAHIAAVLQPEHLTQACAAWGLDPEAMHLVGQLENFIYASPAQGRVLRLTHSSHRTETAIAAELSWIMALAEAGIAVAEPHRALDGGWYLVLPATAGTFYASVFTHIAGTVLPRHRPEVWTPTLLFRLGEIAAAMHRVSAHLEPLARPQWDQDGLVEHLQIYVPATQTEIYHQARHIHQQLAQLPQTPATYGLIHTDMHQGNFILNAQQEPVFFDFDDSAYHYYLFDLAMMLYYACMPDFQQTPDFVANYARYVLAGYQSQTALPTHWAETCELFFRWRDLQIYTLCYKKELLQDADWQERHRAMGARIIAGVPPIRLL